MKMNSFDFFFKNLKYVTIEKTLRIKNLFQFRGKIKRVKVFMYSINSFFLLFLNYWVYNDEN